MLNEGTSIEASICVSVRQKEGKHERPLQSFYGFKDFVFVSLTWSFKVSLQLTKTPVTLAKLKTWNVLFFGVPKLATITSTHLLRGEKRSQAWSEAFPACTLPDGETCFHHKSFNRQLYLWRPLKSCYRVERYRSNAWFFRPPREHNLQNKEALLTFAWLRPEV